MPKLSLNKLSTLALLMAATILVSTSPALASELNLQQMRSVQEPAPSVMPSYEALERARPPVLVRRLEFKRRPRVVPLGWELAGVVVGAGATAAGVTLSALDGRCARYSNIGAGPECSQIYDTKISGVAMLTSGVMIFGSAMVMMLIDARRGWDPEYRYVEQ